MSAIIENPYKYPINEPVIPTPTSMPRKACDYDMPSQGDFEFTWEGQDSSVLEVAEGNSFETNIQLASQKIVNTLAQTNPTLANILEDGENANVPYWVTYRFITQFMYADLEKPKSVENILADQTVLMDYPQFMVVLAKTTQQSVFSSLDSNCTTPMRQILLELLYTGDITQEEKDAIIFMLTDAYNEYSKDKNLNDECTFDYDGFIYFVNEQRFGFTKKIAAENGLKSTAKNPCDATPKQTGKHFKLENKEIQRLEKLADINRPLTIRNYKNR